MVGKGSRSWAVSRELGDPARISDVNSRSGVTESALSLANWATRLGWGSDALRWDGQFGLLDSVRVLGFG